VNGVGGFLSPTIGQLPMSLIMRRWQPPFIENCIADMVVYDPPLVTALHFCSREW
jgi:hypothetical protein